MQVLWTEAEKARAKELDGETEEQAADIINKEFHGRTRVRTGRAIRMMRVRNFPTGRLPRWDIEKETELLWLVRHPDKLSSSQIGRRMGISRMAVIGKCRRMGLFLPNRQVRAWVKPGKAARKKEPQVFDGISDTPEPLTLYTPTQGPVCQCITNDDMKKPEFCGKEVVGRTSWCETHYAEFCNKERT